MTWLEEGTYLGQVAGGRDLLGAGLEGYNLAPLMSSLPD